MHICRMNQHSSRCWRYKRKWDKNPRPLELILSGLVDWLVDWLMYGLMNEWISLGKSFMIIFYRNYLTWFLPLSGTRTLARDGVQLSLSILNPTLVSIHKLHPKALLYSRNYWKNWRNKWRNYWKGLSFVPHILTFKGVQFINPAGLFILSFLYPNSIQLHKNLDQSRHFFTTFLTSLLSQAHPYHIPMFPPAPTSPVIVRI